MRSFYLPHDLNPVMDPTPPAPLTEAELFQKDDLEFRAITTLLGILGTRERITLDNFHVSRQQRPSLKLLTALSSLLVRDVETITVIPKRSVRGTTLFVCPAADNTIEKDFRDAKSTSSMGSSFSEVTFIARNLKHEDPVGPVELLKCPIVQVDSNIFRFILKNWFVILPARKPSPLISFSRDLGTSRSNIMFNPFRSFLTTRSPTLMTTSHGEPSTYIPSFSPHPKYTNDSRVVIVPG